MPIEEDEVSSLWEKLWRSLWAKLFKAAWILAGLLCAIGITLVAVIICLLNIDSNQHAQIANQRAIATAVMDGQTTMLAKQQEMLVEAKRATAAAVVSAQAAADAVVIAQASSEAAVKAAAQNAAIAQHAAENRPAPVVTHNTVIERRVTPESESDRSKQLDQKNDKADQTQKKLDHLVHQYKRAMKGENPNQ